MKDHKKKKKKEKKKNPIDEWVSANFERLMLNPNLQKMFKTKDEDVLKRVSNAFEDEEWVKSGSLKGLEPFKDRYNEKDILNLAETLNWKGNGTKTDPIIIESVERLPKMFSITSNLYITIKSCVLDHLILYNCQNISIESCSLNILGILKSSKSQIKNSSISTLNLEYSRNIYFLECSIIKANTKKSQANIFEDCDLSMDTVKSLQESQYELVNLVKQLPYIIIAAAFGIAVLTLIEIFNSSPFGLYWYLSIIMLLGLVIAFILLSRRQKKNIPNKIIKNGEIEENSN